VPRAAGGAPLALHFCSWAMQPKARSPEDRGTDQAMVACPRTLARPHHLPPNAPARRAPGLPCALAPGGEPSARVHPPSPAACSPRLAGAGGRCGVTAPCCQRELPHCSRAGGGDRTPRAPAAAALRLRSAPHRARGRALPGCRVPCAPGALARSLSPLLSATCRL
jgi:hypothetical protein